MRGVWLSLHPSTNTTPDKHMMSGSSKPASPIMNMKERLAAGRPWNLLAPMMTGLAALLVYFLTMAPDLTWSNFGSDGGELITASITSGIAHPPGYPTYIFLGKIAALLPFGSVAWRFNFFSAVSAATAVAFITATAQLVLKGGAKKEAVAAAAGLCVAFAPLFWGQALISEVYALNSAVLAVLLWSVLNGRRPLLSGFLCGLAISTHLSSLIMLPFVLALTARNRRLALLCGLLLGLLPLLALPFLARSSSPVVWGNPSTLRGWLWLVSGRLYYANLRLPEMSMALTRLLYLGRTLLQQWLWIGWFFVILGMTSRLLDKRLTLALTFTGLTYFFYGYFYQTEDAIITLLPLLILFSPLLAAGLSRIGAWSFILPFLLLVVNYQSLNLHEDQTIRPLAREVLLSAPEGAILLTPGDQSIFTLWYFQHVERMREDLVLVDANLFAFDWYRERLSRLYPDLAGLDKDNLEVFRKSNSQTRSICMVQAALEGATRCTP
jgi:hypothetical protein